MLCMSRAWYECAEQKQAGTAGGPTKTVPSKGYVMYHVIPATLKCTTIAGLHERMLGFDVPAKVKAGTDVLKLNDMVSFQVHIQMHAFVHICTEHLQAAHQLFCF